MQQHNAQFQEYESEIPHQQKGISDFPISRKWLSSVLIAFICAPLSAMCASALAGIGISILSVPVAFLATRDVYLSLLAISYGPYSAAYIIQWLILTLLIWSIGLPIYSVRTSRNDVIFVSIFTMLCAIIAGIGQPFVDSLLPIVRIYTPSFITLGEAAILVIATGIAGGFSHYLFQRRHKTSRNDESNTLQPQRNNTRWSYLRQLLSLQVLAAIYIAVASEATIALLTAFNLI